VKPFELLSRVATLPQNPERRKSACTIQSQRSSVRWLGPLKLPQNGKCRLVVHHTHTHTGCLPCTVLCLVPVVNLYSVLHEFLVHLAIIETRLLFFMYYGEKIPLHQRTFATYANLVSLFLVSWHHHDETSILARRVELNMCRSGYHRWPASIGGSRRRRHGLCGFGRTTTTCCRSYCRSYCRSRCRMTVLWYAFGIELNGSDLQAILHFLVL
jgi:hypothetical protein